MDCHDYTCAECGGTFHTDRSEADAFMEYQELFSEAERASDPDMPVVICDDCWPKVMRRVELLRRSAPETSSGTNAS